MTSLDTIRQRPGHAGQATQVEQSRAVAQVQAAVVIAMEYRRDEDLATEAMLAACGRKALADVAFFSFERGREEVTGPSIHLARELARVWGNIDYGVHELVRDDVRGQSEVLAYAWDLQTNARNSAIFIVPHVRDRSGGPAALTSARDIYENNANAGARRVREAIFAVLPRWFTDQAQDACRTAILAELKDTSVPHEERVANCVAQFAKGGVTIAQLEKRVGQPQAEWTAEHLADLGVLYTSLRSGDITKDEAFPAAAAVKPEELAGKTAAAGKPAPKVSLDRLNEMLAGLPIGPDERRREDERILLNWLAGGEWTATTGQVRMVTAQLKSFLDAAKGDPEEAVTAMWLRFGEQNPEAAT